MFNNILLIEPMHCEDYYPFSIMHCVWELRTGCLMQFEKVKQLFHSSNIYYHTNRNLHLNSFIKRFDISEPTFNPDNLLVIDSSLLITTEVANIIKNFINENNGHNSLCFKVNDKIVAYYFSSNVLNNFNDKSEIYKLINDTEHKIIQIEAFTLNYLWDTLEYVNLILKDDFQNIYKSINSNKYNFNGAYLINPENIYISSNCNILPGCVLDASNGPIIIDENCNIMPNSVIIGPVFIGNNSTIKIGAKIYGNTIIGPVCKAGGEIENSIIHSFSNKQHEGFLGHSYICEWVNIGADTNNSDLKNTYAEIKMSLPQKDINTSRRFLGLMMGDHTKTAINSTFNTGTTTGICGILVNEGFFPTFIKSFAWGGKKGSIKYKLSKAIEIAGIVMKRRGKELSEEEKLLFEYEYTKID